MFVHPGDFLLQSEEDELDSSLDDPEDESNFSLGFFEIAPGRDLLKSKLN